MTMLLTLLSRKKLDMSSSLSIEERMFFRNVVDVPLISRGFFLSS